MNHTSTENEQAIFKTPKPSLIHPVMEALKRPSGDTSSGRAFSTLDQWLSHCQTEHTKCNSWSGGTLPRRVLEIQSVQPLCVRVVENCSQKEKYACLSYRWGPETKSKSLNKGNLEKYKAAIPQDKLYPLVKDAITAADRLGLRYIWIDSYCILQDDTEDWETEAANMASMFSTSKPEDLGAQVTERGGESVFVRKRLSNPSGTTLDRAWVFQERLLSNRVIYFTKHEVAWECRERSWCECESCNDEFSSWLGPPSVPKVLQQLKWEDIAKVYDSKILTEEKDRLPALAGVARRHGELRGWTYLAGLWKEEIPTALLWKKLGHKGARPLRQQLEVAPTWSWASLPRGKLFFHGRPLTSVRLIGYNRSPPDGDIYTATGQTEITVQGPVLDVRIYHQGQLREDEGPKLIGKIGNAFLTITPDFDMKPKDPTKYQAVVDGTLGSLLLLYDETDPDTRGGSYRDCIFGVLLLQKTDANGGKVTFERVGCFNDLIHSQLDESGEFVEYRGGSFPFQRMKRVKREWLLQRAEKRRITLV
ncbi:hypothetical protein KVR01_013032 [Diaporthe batatas]|uniref:uncharacterized protein n=1 Tax=Diaporthe batatas TaxID=748121 RepID=UPI001D053EB7|nr:uncharacterized protein KVR01_013032 [Diaporthe batatas]KAG8157042.1 hypothetical protein KVR01_013032 [Diaporthe batatas]